MPNVFKTLRFLCQILCISFMLVTKASLCLTMLHSFHEWLGLFTSHLNFSSVDDIEWWLADSKKVCVISAYLSQNGTHIILLTLSLQGQVGENRCCVRMHMNFPLHLAGYVSDPMSTMRFHSCSSSGSFEESSWQHGPPYCRKSPKTSSNCSYHTSLTPKHRVLYWWYPNWTLYLLTMNVPLMLCASIFFCLSWGGFFFWWCASTL